MDIQLTVTILLIYTKCLNNTLSSLEETLVNASQLLGQSLLANAEKLLELCPDPGEAQGLRQAEGQSQAPDRPKCLPKAQSGPEQPD